MSQLEAFGVLPPDHHVPDVLAAGLKVVFCGTALGRKSAQARAYYAHPGNLFWRTLQETGLTPGRIAPVDFRSALDHGIGLTDLCKHHYGQDNQLPGEAYDADALRDKIRRYQPGILAFTSKTAASAFLGRRTGNVPLGFQTDTVGVTRIFVLPSPSGLARSYWHPRAWQALAEAVRQG